MIILRFHPMISHDLQVICQVGIARYYQSSISEGTQILCRIKTEKTRLTHAACFYWAVCVRECCAQRLGSIFYQNQLPFVTKTAELDQVAAQPEQMHRPNPANFQSTPTLSTAFSPVPL